jgi:hypothetical protein
MGEKERAGIAANIDTVKPLARCHALSVTFCDSSPKGASQGNEDKLVMLINYQPARKVCLTHNPLAGKSPYFKINNATLLGSPFGGAGERSETEKAYHSEVTERARLSRRSQQKSKSTT